MWGNFCVWLSAPPMGAEVRVRFPTCRPGVPAWAIRPRQARVDKTCMTACGYCGGDLDEHDYVERMHCERLAAAMARLTTDMGIALALGASQR